MKTGAVAALIVLAPSAALAGAWNQPSGRTQVIVKAESMAADEAFDIDGSRQPMPGEREDNLLSVFAEHGLTDRLTVQLKSEWQQGSDVGLDYEGLGPTEIGVRLQVWRSDTTALAIYGGYAFAGEARNAGYAPPGAGDGDWEVRALAGHNLDPDWLGGRTGFVEIQAARRFRTGLPDEDRLDLTFGVEAFHNWDLLSQVYAGRTIGGSEAIWVNSEVSVVRRLGDWSLQAGWRQAVAGRNTPAQQGFILGVWRRF